MSRSTLFDRLNQELEAFGKKAQAALDEGKLQIELMRVRRKRDSAARELGLLVYQRERGSQVETRRTDALLIKLDGLEAELARVGQQLEDAKRQRPTRSTATPRPTQAGTGKPTQSGTGEPTQSETGVSTQSEAGVSTQSGTGVSTPSGADVPTPSGTSEPTRPAA